MSARWIAGAVRARALAERRAGPERARSVAAADGLSAALRELSGSAYGRRLHQGLDLAAAEYAVDQTLLWNLRVLAGWLPYRGVAMLRDLSCGFEAADILGRMRELGGEPAGPPYELGALALVWPAARQATSAARIRRELAFSPWGDPGSDSPADLAVFLRLSGSVRLSRTDPAAERWAAADAALTVGREVFVADRPLGPAARRTAAKLLGPAAAAAGSWEEFVARLPRSASWVLAGIASPDSLWLAEANWRRKTEADALELLRRSGLAPGAALGAAMALSADAWRIRAALEAAARGGRPSEVFDVVA